MAEEIQTKVETKEGGEPTKIKVGETEFTNEELQGLVESGKRLTDIETKQGQPIDKILESWGRRGERLGEWKKATGAEKPDEFLKAKETELNKPKEQVDREKIKAQVIAEAKEFGLLTKEEAVEEFNKIYETRRAGEKMFGSVNRVLKKAESEGRPVCTPEELLEFMAHPDNPKDPEKAYKLKYEKELDEWKINQLNKMSKKGIITETKTTAGGKEFTSEAPTNANLTDLLKEHFSAS
mgnify:CR=1 FL=1